VSAPIHSLDPSFGRARAIALLLINRREIPSRFRSRARLADLEKRRPALTAAFICAAPVRARARARFLYYYRGSHKY